MSRLFEALQRSEPEGFSFEIALPPPPVAGDAVHPVEVHSSVQGIEPFPSFPTLRISVLPDSRLVAVTEKESLAAEKFRFLAVRLRQLQQTRPLRKVLITSTIPEEGKSTVSSNLSVILARKKRQAVLLVEGDLRRPVLASQFGLSNLRGLGEFLQGDSGLMEKIYYLEELGLWFLPAGPPPENPLELLQSGRMAELMEQLTKWFDWIVIDSPPVLPLGDTSVWARLVDGIMLVAREGTTRKRELKRGLDVLDHSKFLGLVLNNSNSTDQSNYYQRYGPQRQMQSNS
jgi:capsular exopolysaccharide synthesis family protein